MNETLTSGAESGENEVQQMLATALEKIGHSDIQVIPASGDPNTLYIPRRNVPEGVDLINFMSFLTAELGDEYDVVYGAGGKGIEIEAGIIETECIEITRA